MDVIDSEEGDIWIWSISKYDGFQDVKDKHSKRIDRIPPDKLYHYTSAEGIRGIIKSKNIRMTDMRYMNDASELQYCSNIIKEVIENNYANENKDVSRLINRMYNISDSVKRDFNIYAACFCEKRNKASFWNDYGKYSIAIDTSNQIRVENRFTRIAEWYKAIFRKVLYKRNKQKELIKEAVEDVISSFKLNKEKKDADINNLTNNASTLFYNIVLEYFVSFKNPIFREEEEWRMLFFQFERDADDIENVKTYVKGDYIIPYVDMGIIETSVNEYRDVLDIMYKVREYNRAYSDKNREKGDKIYRIRKIDYGKIDIIKEDVAYVFSSVPYNSVAEHRKAAGAVGEFPLKAINIGPVRHSEIARRSVRKELLKNGLDEVVLNEMEVPIRSEW